MAEIHPTAIIDPTAELADDVKIGPYSIVGPHVELGSGCGAVTGVTATSVMKHLKKLKR